MKNLKLHVILLGVLAYCGIWGSCSKMDATYDEFIESGLKVYSVNPDTVWANPGNDRVQLVWIMETTAHVERYAIYWNDGQDSLAGAIREILAGDTASVIINNLSDGIYDFKVYTYDKGGNRSVGKEVTGEAFGSDYIASLNNRLLQGVRALGSALKLFWYPVDTSNIKTQVRYTDQSDQEQSISLANSELNSFLENWKPGTKIYYKSTFKPTQNAIDTFSVADWDSVGIRYQMDVEVDKQLWKDARTAYDAPDGKVSDGLKWLWDGQPAAYPEVFYAKGDRMPNSFTIDLGKVYDQLTRLEEWGRQSYSKTNPKKFEVWGIEDTSSSLVNMYPDETDWADSMRAKGWTLLTTVERDDDGQTGWEADIMSGPPPVRFICIRVLSHIGSGDERTQLSELTFWCNQFTLSQ